MSPTLNRLGKSPIKHMLSCRLTLINNIANNIDLRNNKLHKLGTK